MSRICTETTLDEVLSRYPRLAAHLICESLGYFTPHAAANAIKHHALSRPFACEWYVHMAGWGRDALVAVNRETVAAAFRHRGRHQGFMADYRRARELVRQALAGQAPELASWS